jgi:hypothetical protein
MTIPNVKDLQSTNKRLSNTNPIDKRVSRIASSSCSTSGIRLVPLFANILKGNERGNDEIVIVANGIYSCTVICDTGIDSVPVYRVMMATVNIVILSLSTDFGQSFTHNLNLFVNYLLTQVLVYLCYYH